MKEIFIRLNNESPSFFKKLKNLGLICAGIGATLATAPIALPALAITAGGYLATVGATIAIVSQFTVSDNSVLPPSGNPTLPPK